MRACIALLVAGCGTSPPQPIDICMVKESGEAGSAVIAHGPGNDTLVMDGETLTTQLGPQGFYMFVVRARVSDLAIDDGDIAAVFSSATNSAGTPISLDFGCAEHAFADAGDGWMQMTGPQITAISPQYTQDLMGGMVKLDLRVRDRDGHTAATQSTVKAAIP